MRTPSAAAEKCPGNEVLSVITGFLQDKHCTRLPALQFCKSAVAAFHQPWIVATAFSAGVWLRRIRPVNRHAAPTLVTYRRSRQRAAKPH